MTDSSSPSSLRWWPAAILLVVSLLFLLGAWTFASDLTWKVVWSWYIVSITAILLLVWWVAGSGLSWVAKLLGLAGVIAAGGLFFLCFRPTGFDGAMIPEFALRWKASPAAARREYFAENLSRLTAQSDDETDPAVLPPTDQIESTGEEKKQLQANSSSSLISEAETDWPGFRGPRRDGIVTGVRLETNWDLSPPKLLWKHPIGEGWSSFAIRGDLAITQEQHEKLECVTCYHASTGEPIWLHTDEVRFESEMGGNGPRATPTLTSDRVYALGAKGLLNCLDLQTGRKIWQRNILVDAGAKNLSWGMAGSPLVLEQEKLVVVNPGGSTGRSVIAYHMDSGEIIWSSGDSPAGYHAPCLTSIDGVSQILVFHGDGLASYAVEDGRELWKYPWRNTFEINVAQPIVRDERFVFLSSGYSSGSALLEVTRNTHGEWPKLPKSVWVKENFFKLKFNDAVYRDGYLYGLDDGILSCIEYSTGDRKWKKGRYKFGQLLLFENVLLIMAEDGDLVLVEANSRRFEEIARFTALEGRTWNLPAFSNGRLFIRNGQQAACYELSCENVAPVNPDDGDLQSDP